MNKDRLDPIPKEALKPVDSGQSALANMMNFLLTKARENGIQPGSPKSRDLVRELNKGAVGVSTTAPDIKDDVK